MKNKTTETSKSVTAFIRALPDAKKQKEALILLEIYREVTGYEPKMWGPTIIGFGTYHYKYASGREGDAPLAGFSPRKPAFVVYLSCEEEDNGALLKKLGKYTMSKACVYFKKLDDIDIAVLKKLILHSVKYTKEKYK